MAVFCAGTYQHRQWFYGLSTDTKPTDRVNNGDKFIEINTSKEFLFDKDIEDWIEQASVANIGRQKIKTDEGTSDLELPEGETQTITIAPPAGKIWRLLSLDVRINANDATDPEADSGTHQFIVRWGDVEPILIGRTAYNKDAVYRAFQFTNSTDDQSPADPILQKIILDNVWISNDTPLYIIYQNNTNRPTTANRQWGYIIAEEDEV